MMPKRRLWRRKCNWRSWVHSWRSAGNSQAEIPSQKRERQKADRVSKARGTGNPYNMIPSTAEEMGKHSNPMSPVEFGESISSIYDLSHEWEEEWSKWIAVVARLSDYLPEKDYVSLSSVSQYSAITRTHPDERVDGLILGVLRENIL